MSNQNFLFQVALAVSILSLTAIVNINIRFAKHKKDAVFSILRSLFYILLILSQCYFFWVFGKELISKEPLDRSAVIIIAMGFANIVFVIMMYFFTKIINILGRMWGTIENFSCINQNKEKKITDQ